MVTVIIPTYNRGHIIAGAIESVLNQTYSQWKLIIVDDCSTDNTSAVVGRYTDNRIAYVIMERNRGAAHCRNYGLRMVNTPYVAFLDSDDVFHPEKLSKHLQLFERENLDCTVSTCARHDFNTNHTEPLLDIRPESNLLLEFIVKTVTWKMYPVWRTDFLVSNDIFFHEELSNSQDYQFNALAIIHEPRVGYLMEILGTKNEYGKNDDPVKIGIKKGSVKSVKSHLLSRKLIIDYLKNRSIDETTHRQIRKYIWKHRLSCFNTAYRISFFSLISTLIYSIRLKIVH